MSGQQTNADEITLVAGPWTSGIYYPAATMVLAWLELPNWTVATRPGAPLNPGRIGFNTDLGTQEEWNGSAWIQMQSGGTSAVASTALPVMDGVASSGVSGAWSPGDHVHPTDTSRYAASNPSGYQTAAQLAAAVATYAPLASPALTGIPTAPTAAANTSTTQVATTAFVEGQASNAAPAMDGVAAPGSLLTFARGDHVHPADSSRAPLASPALSGVPTAPTAAPGTNTTQLATTAFVTATDAALAPIASPTFTGTVTIPAGALIAGYLTSASAAATYQTALGYTPYNATNPSGYQTAAQVTASLVPYAPLASPAFTGVPAAPTASPGASTTQVATTAFVTAAVVAASSGVVTFNTRSGAVVLSSADVTTALSFTPYNSTNPSGYQTAANVTTTLAAYALLASPTFSGTPTLPTGTIATTQTAGNSTTAVATTAFTTGAVATETTARTTAEALLAPLASPALSGTPTAPTVAATAAAGTTQLATTAFVRNGTTTSDSAIAGQVGEYISQSSTLTVAVTSGPTYNIIGLSLTAGDWDVRGTVSWLPAGTTTVNSLVAAISTASGANPGPSSGMQSEIQGTLTTGGQQSLPCGPGRISLASTTTVYLLATAGFGTSTMAAGGFIGARRMR